MCCLFVLQNFGVHHALNPDPYRGVFGNNGEAYAEDVRDLIRCATPGKVGAPFFTIKLTVHGVHIMLGSRDRLLLYIIF